MGFDLKKIRKFDNSLKTIDERREYVEKLLGDNVEMIDEHNHGAMLESDRLSENMPLNITIEEFGTYLLKSGDAESCRSGEYTFYETERDYRSRYKIGKASIATDMSSNDEFIDYAGESVDSCLYINVSTMDSTQVKRLIRMGLSEKDVDGSGLQDVMSEIYEISRKRIDEKDLPVFEMMVDGMSDGEISDALGIPRRSVNYMVNRIVKSIGGACRDGGLRE